MLGHPLSGAVPHGPFQVQAQFVINDRLTALGQGAPVPVSGWAVDSEGSLYCHGRCVGALVDAQAQIAQPSPLSYVSGNSLAPAATMHFSRATEITAILDFDLYTE